MQAPARLYTGLMAIWLVILGILCVSFGKPALFIPVNYYRSEAWDYVMSFFNLFGNGCAIAVMVPVCYFISKSKKAVLYLVAVFLLASLVSCLFKHLYQAPRPAAFFAGSSIPVFTAGWIKLAYTHSFPSGHTTTAFAMATVMAWFSRKKWLALIWFFLACMAGYARVYLGQHFVQDVYGGAIYGFLAAIVCLYIHPALKYLSQLRRKEIHFNSGLEISPRQ